MEAYLDAVYMALFYTLVVFLAPWWFVLLVVWAALLPD